MTLLKQRNTLFINELSIKLLKIISCIKKQLTEILATLYLFSTNNAVCPNQTLIYKIKANFFLNLIFSTHLEKIIIAELILILQININI